MTNQEYVAVNVHVMAQLIVYPKHPVEMVGSCATTKWCMRTIEEGKAEDVPEFDSYTEAIQAAIRYLYQEHEER